MKCILYPGTPTFGCNFLTKSLGGIGVIFLHRSRGWKDFLCVLVCVCDHSTGRNFYLIAIKFGTQIGLVKRQIKMGYVGPIGTPRGAPPNN